MLSVWFFLMEILSYRKIAIVKKIVKMHSDLLHKELLSHEVNNSVRIFVTLILPPHRISTNVLQHASST